MNTKASFKYTCGSVFDAANFVGHGGILKDNFRAFNSLESQKEVLIGISASLLFF